MSSESADERYENGNSANDGGAEILKKEIYDQDDKNDGFKEGVDDFFNRYMRRSLLYPGQSYNQCHRALFFSFLPSLLRTPWKHPSHWRRVVDKRRSQLLGCR